MPCDCQTHPARPNRLSLKVGQDQEPEFPMRLIRLLLSETLCLLEAPWHKYNAVVLPSHTRPSFSVRRGVGRASQQRQRKGHAPAAVRQWSHAGRHAT